MDINALFNLAVGTLYAYAIVAGVYALVKNQIRLRRHRRKMREQRDVLTSRQGEPCEH